MAEQLPVAIVVPHSGLAVPPELEGRIALTAQQIFNEADAYTDLIYAYQERALHWHSFPYARALIDVNRPADPALHHRPGDGAVKRVTSYGADVFLPGREPDAELERQLIQRYWQPWHDRLAAITRDERVKLVIDCHSMAALGPSSFDDPAQIRPCVSVSNLGDADGNADVQQQLSAPPELGRLLAEQLASALSAAPLFAPVGKPVAVNLPFRGGWDLMAHGGKLQPWLMIELNRALYIGAQSGESAVVPPNDDLIAPLRECLWGAIERTVGSL